MALSFRCRTLAMNPVAHRRRRDRSDRPSSGVGRNPNIAKLELALPATSPSAVSSRCTNQAARAGRDAPRPIGDVFGAPSRRDKEHHRASRKCRSESTV